MRRAYHGSTAGKAMTGLDYILPIVLGISLAAAVGLRVFVPLLVVGLASREGMLPLGETFAWASTAPALLMLSIAAVAEIAAYYLPGLDNLLDGLATPAAIIAGIAISAAVMIDLPPMLKWTLAIIAGGGAAAITQGATTALRGHSTAFTAGLGNHILATGELLGAVLVPLIAIIWPFLALVIAMCVLLLAFWLARWLMQKRSQPSSPDA
jgi:Domain of unknown function (DUF4126)